MTTIDIKDVREKPSEFALGMAAQCWCGPTASRIVMDVELATEFARVIDRYREALIWCGGSADFGRGGKAEVGYNRMCRSLLGDDGWRWRKLGGNGNQVGPKLTTEEKERQQKAEA